MVWKRIQLAPLPSDEGGLWPRGVGGSLRLAGDGDENAGLLLPEIAGSLLLDLPGSVGSLLPPGLEATYSHTERIPLETFGAWDPAAPTTKSSRWTSA